MLKNKIISTACFAAVQIMIILVLADRGRTDYAWSVFVTTGVWIVYAIIEVKFHITVSRYVRVLMMLTLFADAFFGYVLNLYEQSFVFDKLLHVFGTYSMALFFYSLIIKLQDGSMNKIVIFLFVLCLGLALGTVYEIAEFIGDHISHPQPSNQPGLLDTDIDLIGDFIGAALAGAHAAFWNQAHIKARRN